MSGRTVKRLSVSVVVWAIAILMLAPLLWMLSASFKASTNVFEYPVHWIPQHPTTQGYQLLASPGFNFVKIYLNTLYVAFMSCLGVFVVGSLAAYAYAKIHFRGRDIMFLVIMSSLAIPFQVVMIPQFILFKALGLLDTLTSQWIGAFASPVFGIFLLRQAFKSIPDSLIDAAKIDGCSHLRILWQIVIPMSKPTLVTVILLYFISSWNNYETALIFIRSLDKYVISLGVELFSTQFSVNFTAIMAASVITIVPLLIILVAAQRYIISGLTVGALKE